MAETKVTAGEIEQGGWITPTMQNSWVNYDGGTTYNTCAYRKDEMGYVHLKGLIKNGTVNPAAFTLPSGYIPILRCIFATSSNNLYGQVRVQTDGQGVPYSPSVNNWVSLDGISFKAEQ